MQISILTASEEQLMRIAWQLKSFFMKDLVEAYPEPKPHQNTISTYLKILTEKKFLSVEKIGRIFKYSILVSREDYLHFVLKKLLKENFNSDSKELIQFLIDEKIVSFEDFNHFFQVKTTLIPVNAHKKETPNAISEFIEEITKTKKKKKKDKKKKK